MLNVFWPVRAGLTAKWSIALGALLLCLVLAPGASAYPLTGTTPVTAGMSVLPGIVPPGTPPGDLLASQTVSFSYHPFNNASLVTSGTVMEAVYSDPTEGGTLDFYYQVMNDASSASAIARVTASDFAGFLTAVGFRTDAVGPFVVGTVAPPPTALADRSTNDQTVGFNFQPPATGEISPGSTSVTLVISTNAKTFTLGSFSLIDGGTQTIAGYQPAGMVPEPASMALIGGGFLLLAAIRRYRR